MIERTSPGVAAGRWRTSANGLSLMRLAAAPLLAAALLGGQAVAAAVLVVVAIASDFADGAIARRRGESSPLGGLLDHAADASFVTLGLAALAVRGEAPWPLAPLVALAFAQYVFDSRATRGAPLRASRLGRWNGIAYFVPVAAAAGRDALALGWPPPSWLHALGWVLVGTTLLSMADRLRRHATGSDDPGAAGITRRSRGSPGAGRRDRSPR